MRLYLGYTALIIALYNLQRVWEPLLKLRVKFEKFESGRFNDEGTKRYKCLWVRFMELPVPLSRFATSSWSGRSGSSVSLDDDRFFDGLTPGSDEAIDNFNFTMAHLEHRGKLRSRTF